VTGGAVARTPAGGAHQLSVFVLGKGRGPGSWQPAPGPGATVLSTGLTGASPPG
jgi:hypothetical protein